MSALTYILKDVLDELYNKPTALILSEKDFRTHLHEKDLSQSRVVPIPLHCSCFKSKRTLNKANISGCLFEQDSGNFKVDIDVHQFKPEEISVKIVANHIVVEAKHEERKDKYGLISRQFTRRFKMTNCIDYDRISTTLSSDGILTLVAPKKVIKLSEEKSIPIVCLSKPSSNDNEESSFDQLSSN